jgi:hypothetical protein
MVGTCSTSFSLCIRHKLKLVLQVARRRLHAVPPRELFYKVVHEQSFTLTDENGPSSVRNFSGTEPIFVGAG